MGDMQAAKKAGKPIDEVAAAWKIPAKYTGYAAADANRLKNNVRLAYDELDKGAETYCASTSFLMKRSREPFALSKQTYRRETHE
jgi:hypothetical protein